VTYTRNRLLILRSFKRILASGAEYPFACAGVNLCHLMLDVCGLNPTKFKHDPRAPMPEGNAALNGLGQALTRDELLDVYVSAFEVLHSEFVGSNSGYMDFPRVITFTRGRISDALEAYGNDRGEVRDLLGLAPLPLADSTLAAADTKPADPCPTGVLIDFE